MADRGWNPVISRREKKRNRDDELREERLRAEAFHRSNSTQDSAWFNATHPSPTDTAEEYDRNHAELYGAEEKMINGKHRWGSGRSNFPRGSARDEAHTTYSASTAQRNKALKCYDNTLEDHRANNEKMTKEELSYYGHCSNQLLPIQHADLSSRALDCADAARKNGSLRTGFEDRFPYAHHSLELAKHHHRHAEDAFDIHRRYSEKHSRHEELRSSEDDDGHRDCYGRRVTAGAQPHSRSRNHELPPSGSYSAFLITPPHEVEEEEEKEEEEEAEPRANGNGSPPVENREDDHKVPSPGQFLVHPTLPKEVEEEAEQEQEADPSAGGHGSGLANHSSSEGPGHSDGSFNTAEPPQKDWWKWPWKEVDL